LEVVLTDSLSEIITKLLEKPPETSLELLAARSTCHCFGFVNSLSQSIFQVAGIFILKYSFLSYLVVAELVSSVEEDQQEVSKNAKKLTIKNNFIFIKRYLII